MRHARLVSEMRYQLTRLFYGKILYILYIRVYLKGSTTLPVGSSMIL